MKTNTRFDLSPPILHRMKNVSDKSVEKIRTHIVCSITFFENRPVYEPDRPQMTMWRMRIACWITEATDTGSEYLIPITFPLQQWLHERASTVCYTYIACVVDSY